MFSNQMFRFISLVCFACGIIGVVFLYIHSNENNKKSFDVELIRQIWAQKRQSMTQQNYEMGFIEQRLFDKLESIHQSCGEICNTRLSGPPGKYYASIKKAINCDALFNNSQIDEPSEFPTPLKEIPYYLKSDFSYDGRLKIVSDYRAEKAEGQFKDIVWHKEAVDHLVQQFKSGNLNAGSGYGVESIQEILNYLDNYVDVNNKTVLVIGSLAPWLESLLLMKGATHITTFDYIKIVSQHPQIQTLLPNELAAKYFNGDRFDVMVTYSSVEHSGLGRFGDMLNPWGDLIAMARAWCLVKPGGKALVGVPSGPDMIGFNSAKTYGPLGYSHLFANWEQIYTDTDFSKADADKCYYCYQSLHALARS